ncbi:hypothetical protein [Methylocystis bryophila]|uniref:Uncharacterized protein n=1 Tax=Methylocystis bryophila TaxID=655015 RepID=A0A1W6MUQ1_9HYPH|nr:hypothetical protein [Methylocystis bryophila]ARN81297.1 hypothetical protein B1812_09635 [Methylocystis bryophila]BDV37263.1 hypothetical protein DSM21852_05160 [Methylocystis bryophila]
MTTRSVVLAASIAALVLSLASPAAARRSSQQGGGDDGASGGRNDGVWTFNSTTTAGNCPALEPRDVTIQGGRVVSANGGASQPWGYVEGNGTFVARFTDANGHVSRANGRLAGSSGKGAWSSGSDYCGGRWTASRSGR